MNCSTCGRLLEYDDKFQAKISGIVANPLRTSVGAFATDIEWIPGTFTHIDCDDPTGE